MLELASIGLLADMQGDLDALQAQLSSTWSGRLDVAVSTRAPASTALSNATWTNAKAAFLDAAVTSRARVKGVLRGVLIISDFSYSQTATISAVNTGKSELRLLGARWFGSGSSLEDVMVSIRLSSSTTIIAERRGSSERLDVSYELTEWE